MVENTPPTTRGFFNGTNNAFRSIGPHTRIVGQRYDTSSHTAVTILAGCCHQVTPSCLELTVPFLARAPGTPYRHSQKAFHNLLADHGKKLGIPSHTLQGMLDTASIAWQRCYKKLAKKPKRKGRRHRLTSMPLPDAFKPPTGTRLQVPGLGSVRFHKQASPTGRLKSGRIVQRTSGWYLCLCIDTHPNGIPTLGIGKVGIAPGFLHLLTLSTGEKIPHPHERRQTAQRLAQAQRGKRQQLTARLQERLANQRTDRNQKLSRRLVADHQTLAWSKENDKALAQMFGKSVARAGHAQLRGLLAYKCTASGRPFLEVPSQ